MAGMLRRPANLQAFLSILFGNMRNIFILVGILLSCDSFAAKLVADRVPQYLPVFGIGSTSSVAYTGAGGTTGIIINDFGAVTETVRLLSTTASFIAIGANPTANSVSFPLPANTEEVLEILSGSKISAVPQSTSGTLFITHVVTYPTND